MIKDIGFKKVCSEPCVYVWEDSTRGKVVVATYVDDCHASLAGRKKIQHIKAELRKYSGLRDLGPTS